MNKTHATSNKGKRVLEQLARIGPFLPASLTITTKKCGNPNCRCAKEGPIHETALLTWKEQNKTHTLYVPRELRAQARQWTQEWKKLKNLIERMGKEQRAFLRTLTKTGKNSSKSS
jgi:hypothetical protein